MSSRERSTAVDMVRLMALLGICVVNMPFIALPVEAVLSLPPDLADRLALMLVELLFQAKFFLLFSFIFGWGMEVQSQSALRAGASFNRRFARRLAMLALLGVLHVTLVFVGDILLLYAILGLIAWPLRHVSPRRLLCLSAVLVLLGIPVFLGLLVLVGAEMGAMASPDLGGSYIDTVKARLQEWPQAFLFLVLFQGPLALAAFLAGIAGARSGFFEPDNTLRNRLVRLLPGLWLGGLALNITYVIGSTVSNQLESELWVLVGICTVVVGAPLLATAYLVTITLLAERWRLPDLLLLAGRNSLSCYVLQGIIAGALFGGYGLGWYNSVGLAALLPLSLLVATVSILIVGVYARRYGMGPLEALLRRVTYG